MLYRLYYGVAQHLDKGLLVATCPLPEPAKRWHHRARGQRSKWFDPANVPMLRYNNFINFQKT